MGCGRCVLYLDAPENREVAGDAAIIFAKSPEDLSGKIQTVLHNPALRAEYQQRAVERVRQRYRWEDVTAEYERLFQELLSNKPQKPLLRRVGTPL